MLQRGPRSPGATGKAVIQMCPMENRRIEGPERRRQCANVYSIVSGIHASTKTCIFGSLAIHSEKLKGEEGLNPPIKREWFLNLGTLPEIEW